MLVRPGFEKETIDVTVDGDNCHVQTQQIQATMNPDASAVLESPESFVEGPGIDAYPASAGVQVYGDTLVISGFVPTDCTEVRAVGYRVGQSLHVQIEPSEVTPSDCRSSRMFSVRYLLPDRTDLLVTSSRDFPARLFSGRVTPR